MGMRERRLPGSACKAAAICARCASGPVGSIPAEAKDWCKPAFVVEVGDPAKELLRFAATERPDLIVLGLSAGKKFNSHFRTGVTYTIVSSAPCPVLTMRDAWSDN
ncbi:MAG TPA: universal stress protein [Candidatus Angelobacter sp.]